MKLFLLKRIDGKVGYDEQAAAVVRARSPREARKLAGTRAGDEGPEVWLSTATVRCRELSSYGSAKVILADFRNG